MRCPGLLVLEDGLVFRGYRFGANRDAEGEVVFVTCMTGYQEVCTDPSYHGQMVVFTYPLIGNYGVNFQDAESGRPWAAGVLVREYCEEYSNWQAERGLHAYLEMAGVPGLMGIDTRALTRHLRTYGTMRAVISDYEGPASAQRASLRAKAVTSLSEKPLVAEASVRGRYVPIPGSDVTRARVAVLDCGIKHNILRSLEARGLQPEVLPYDASADEVLARCPAGVLFSNGPGDPATLPETVECMRQLLGTGLPILGICLGHQILGQAIGGTTSRLRFGHHGGNHPVKDLTTGRVHITSQNHEFQVDAQSIPPDSGFTVDKINLNDGSVEGLAHRERPIFSVQYHPEGAPGPQDNQYVFDRFSQLVRATGRG